MPDGSESLTIRTVGQMAAIDAAQWDALAGPDNPFLSHAFLLALEESGSAVARQGWRAQHLLVEDAGQRLLAAAPAYLKSHSYGEYVFDHGWAEAYERAGGTYYPKLLIAVPFTPVTGPRLLVREGPEAPRLRAALTAGAIEVARQLEASSVHVNFANDEDASSLGESGYLQRLGMQYHWDNPGYASFEDFLGQLASRKRKAIRKEREAIARQGLRILTLTGADIKARHWDAFYKFYMDTGNRKWGSPYLTRDFFRRLGASLADKTVLIMAEDDGTLVAGALNLRGTHALYGRNWGCLSDYKFLHFEACYYRAIDFAIQHGLARVEAGAQGPHKIQRGYLPVLTQSQHWIRDRGFREAVENFLRQERAGMKRQMNAILAEDSPYRSTENDPA